VEHYTTAGLYTARVPRRRAVRIVCGVFAGTGAIAIVLWALAGAAPTWYRPARVGDAVAMALADTVEHRLLEEIHRIRDGDGDAWTLRIRDHQINAWLALRLPRWLAHEHEIEWPQAMGTPQVRFRDGFIEACAPVARGKRPAARRHLTLRLRPSLSDDEKLAVEALTATIGRMPFALRIDTALGEHRAEAEVWRAAVADAGAAIPLKDGRTLRLLGLKLGEGTLDLTFRTEP
jgi:hypothetical protein